MGDTNVVLSSSESTTGEPCTLSASISSSQFPSNLTELKMRVVSSSEDVTFYTDKWELLES